MWVCAAGTEEGLGKQTQFPLESVKGDDGQFDGWLSS